MMSQSEEGKKKERRRKEERKNGRRKDEGWKSARPKTAPSSIPARNSNAPKIQIASSAC
jgi:hypothetical protein